MVYYKNKAIRHNMFHINDLRDYDPNRLGDAMPSDLSSLQLLAGRIASIRFSTKTFFLFIFLLFAVVLPNPCSAKDAVQENPSHDLTSAIAKIEPGTAAEKTVLEKIDGGFSTIVNHMASVLFYRIAADQRHYIQLEHEEHYVRKADSQESFSKHNPNGSYPAKTLSEDEIVALGARGQLITAAQGGWYRQGTMGEQKVEYVTIVIDNSSKYIATDPAATRFQKDSGRLSRFDDETLTRTHVDELAQQGRLREDPTLVQQGAKPAYIHSERHGGAPVVVLWLAAGSIFFTFYMRGVNIWGFRHAVEIVRGRYDNPNEPGEVTHFQALSSALSATVGLGNIAGVTIAMAKGGPGAFFWMVMCGLLGMTSKFVECTLGQMYRQVREDGTVLGGPMQYLHVGLKEKGLGTLGMVLSIIFAIMCILASFGGGNMFQANQAGSTVLSMVQKSEINELERINREIKIAAEQVAAGVAGEMDTMIALQQQKQNLQEKMDQMKSVFLPTFGIIFALLVAMVIIGGIKRIGAAASKVVPTMCLMYIAACLFIILKHYARIPDLVMSIFQEAFTPTAFGGGLLGILVIGVQRAAFSNEAGVGSAAIAHSAARTEEPVREGAVALLGPFIDTVVVCSMTALVILITNAWNNDAWIVDQGLAGAALTSVAFENEISWFPYVLAAAVVLFAYSTIVSWSYYGERCWERLFGRSSTIVYKIIYVSCVFVGAISHLGAVLDFSDMMILSMAFPNILGAVILAPTVKRALADYWDRYRAGEFQTFK